MSHSLCKVLDQDNADVCIGGAGLLFMCVSSHWAKYVGTIMIEAQSFLALVVCGSFWRPILPDHSWSQCNKVGPERHNSSHMCMACAD